MEENLDHLRSKKVFNYNFSLEEFEDSELEAAKTLLELSKGSDCIYGVPFTWESRGKRFVIDCCTTPSESHQFPRCHSLPPQRPVVPICDTEISIPTTALRFSPSQTERKLKPSQNKALKNDEKSKDLNEENKKSHKDLKNDEKSKDLNEENKKSHKDLKNDEKSKDLNEENKKSKKHNKCDELKAKITKLYKQQEQLKEAVKKVRIHYEEEKMRLQLCMEKLEAVKLESITRTEGSDGPIEPAEPMSPIGQFTQPNQTYPIKGVLGMTRDVSPLGLPDLNFPAE